MPDGLEETEPVPVPRGVTVSVRGMRVNVAVTLWFIVMSTTQAPVPVHAPVHPVNVEVLEVGVAVSVTLEP